MPLVEMGRLGKALGLKGEMYLIWHGDKLPHAGQEFYLKDGSGRFIKTRVQALRFQKERPVISLNGVNDRTEADKFNGFLVFQDKVDLEQPGEDEVFLSDLLGSKIYLSNGNLVGVLDHVEFPANQQIWVIAGEKGAEILFPAQPCFIEEIFLEEHKIVISPPPGLLEIYNA